MPRPALVLACLAALAASPAAHAWSGLGHRMVGELAERHVGVVHSVAPADGLLVIESIRETRARTPGILGHVLEFTLTGSARALSCKDHGPKATATPGVGRRRVEGRVLVVPLGAGIPPILSHGQTGLASDSPQDPVRLRRWTSTRPRR